MFGRYRGLTAVAALFLAGTELALAQAGGRQAPRVTALAGSRERPGLFTERLVFSTNFCGPVHVHDHALHGLVLRGVLRMAVADSAGRLDLRDYPAGSFVVVPASIRHFEGSGPETEIHLSGIGPLRTVVDSAAPRRCPPAAAP